MEKIVKESDNSIQGSDIQEIIINLRNRDL